jgi:hypothetical protein
MLTLAIPECKWVGNQPPTPTCRFLSCTWGASPRGAAPRAHAQTAPQQLVTKPLDTNDRITVQDNK